ncbi:DNA repair protein radc [Caulobacter sp. AP07]|uniref:RadC family protein n=1 Tax=Caulobacter sp. AP07 TaxID=1144304 RepID=UPI000271E854|nr:DNA repair protein RadC [Caulobacter sp. AP07]EJL35975.1 DNA repair protein radc [Caulobacter sp. AP07]
MSVSPTLSTTQPDPFDPAVAETATLMRFDLMDRTARVRSIARRHGPHVLHDVEVLELHLARAGQEDAGAAADALIARFGGLAAALAADRAELGRHVGEEAVFDLKLLRETAVRVAAAALPGRQPLSSSSAVQIYLKTLMAGLPREEFWVIFLDRKNQLLTSERLGQGTVDHAPVYPREVLRRALELGASAMILVHNHPSGDPSPSRQDLEMTKTIADAAKMLGLHVWDHMIVGGARVLSLKSEGLM